MELAGRIPQEERRRQILGAATEVFARHGFYEAKIEDVALAAGIGKGTIYE
ncbi:MAG: helix-turn-helix transcriptional regulator, partial [Clostridia bacterium]|nr:helix-turn-helix transcriptional regulator [Clostridia bacterium]